jgi:hypothetical protein
MVYSRGRKNSSFDTVFLRHYSIFLLLASPAMHAHAVVQRSVCMHGELECRPTSMGPVFRFFSYNYHANRPTIQ